MMEEPSQTLLVSSSPKPQSNGGHTAHDENDNNKDTDKSSLKAAANLIRTLDTAFAEMSTLSATAARDAEDARRNARAASEVARRYSARSYPTASVFGADTTPARTSSENIGGMYGPPSNKILNNVDDEPAPGMLPSISDDDSKAIDEHEHESAAAMNNTYAGSTHQPAAAGRKRKTHISSSSERLAQSHAEDVLSLSLELERTKQALENEQRKHDETRASLTESRCKNTQLEAQVQKLLNDMETQREDHGRQVNNLEQELKRAQVRVDAAEEDAQLALDLAKGNAESREQVESWLQRALQEVQLLRERLNHVGIDVPSSSHEEQSPKRRASTVRFADSPTTYYEPHETIPPEETISLTPRSQASRSMVAAGRHLLQRSKTLSTPGGDSKLHSVSLTPDESAERRNKLRERLRRSSTSDDDDAPLPAVQQHKREPSSPGTVHGVDMGMATRAIEASRHVAKCLVESGKRLGISGHWWTASSSKIPSGDENVEAMARQYCQSVEAKIVKQTDELRELGALCDYLEQKLVVEDGPSNSKGDPAITKSNGTA